MNLFFRNKQPLQITLKGGSFIIVLAMFLCATSCYSQSSKDNLPIESISFQNSSGELSDKITVEIARTDSTRQRGLMYRRSLSSGEGMLFVFPGKDREIQMWMKNTYVSLDMVFIDSSHRVVGVLENIPILNLKPRTVPAKAKYLLEIAAGEVSRLGIGRGSILKVDGELEDAIS